jgi:hypothetical protein
MAERLKNTLTFDLAPGATVVLTHGLQTSRPRPLGPDIIFLPSPNLSVTATTTTVTLTNTGPAAVAGAVLVEAWHTIERAFEDVNDEDLPVKPYIVVGSEVGNEPPIPPFTATQLIIYANATGNDTTGTGTEAKPYRTLQRAVRDVPPFIPPSVQYFINITNLGDEVLPPDYALPAWVGSRAFFDSNVMIVADQEPVRSLSPAARTVTVTAASANYTTKTIQVTDASQNWAPDSLKGQFLSFGDPADPLISVVYSNTNNTLFVSGNDGDPVVPQPGWEGTITEPSARFQVSNPASPAGFHVSNISDIYIAGIRVENLSDPEAFSFLAYNSGLVIERSQIIRGWFQNSPRQYYFVSSYGLGASFDSRLYLSRSYIVDSGAGFTSPAQLALMIHSGTVLENTNVQVGLPAVVDGAAVGGGLAISGVLMKNAPSDAVKMIGGTGVISGLQVDDTQDGGNALSFTGPCKYVLGSVIGTGNEGVGVFCTDGAQIECKTVAGTGDKIEFFLDPEAGGVMLLTKVGAGFKDGAQTVGISGSANPLVNDGTFMVFAVFDPDTLLYGNPVGITEDPFLGNFVVDPVTVTGTADQKVGDLAPGAWPAVPFNIVDVYAGANPNMTGTGARLFNK